MNTKDMIISKLTSGKFLFTIIVAVVYAYLAITKALPVDKVNEITLIVLYAYFTKQDKQNGGEQK